MSRGEDGTRTVPVPTAAAPALVTAAPWVPASAAAVEDYNYSSRLQPRPQPNHYPESLYERRFSYPRQPAATHQEPREDAFVPQLAVRGNDLHPSDIVGWKTSGKQVSQRLNKPQLNEVTQSSKSTSQFSEAKAKRMIARITKASRMPLNLPREEQKIAIRPSGGLCLARLEADIVMSAVITAANVPKTAAKADTICTNPTQNIIVISTPDDKRARYYASVRSLHIGGRNYETHAYCTAPHGTVKGVIHHAVRCKPRCKLCNGSHATGAEGCANKYNMPFVVTQRHENDRLKRCIAEQRVQAPVTTEANSAKPKTIDVARTSEPTPKKRALEHARERSVKARLDTLEKCQDRLEQTMKANYEILSQAIKATNDRLDATNARLDTLTYNAAKQPHYGSCKYKPYGPPSGQSTFARRYTPRIYPNTARRHAPPRDTSSGVVQHVLIILKRQRPKAAPPRV
ncbi:hypothetical protein HPB49_005691 [Dermacentor silvarum]|uniref:Uncharacterized protein n=1 Tax=Dermacentor silvarum TaxID=543639 RepID=A0ACB8D368_DERSI|nr:hypothetical protein HPB49_005691 [Dermacentor silvarum]